MYQYVGIGMAKETLLVGNEHTAKPKGTALNKTVDIISETNPYHLFFFSLPKRSFMPSRSKPRVKRIVWSRGFVCDVAKT